MSEVTYSKKNLVEEMQQVPVACAIFSVPELVLKAANSAYFQMAQRANEQFGCEPLYSTLPEAGAIIENLLAEVAETQTAAMKNQGQALVIRNGRLQARYFNFYCEPLGVAQGNMQTIILVACDVTETVGAQVQAERTAEIFRLMIDQSPFALALLRGKECVIEHANASMLKMMSRRPEDGVDRELLDALPELSFPPVKDMLSRAAATGETQAEKESLVHIDRAPCNYVDITCTPLTNPNGTADAMMLTMYDVSEKVNRRKTIEDDQRRLRLLIEASGSGTWELNLKTREFLYSADFLATYGIRDRLSHQEFLHFMHPDDISIRQKAFHEALLTGCLHYVSRVVSKDKTIRWVEVHGKVIFDETGKAFKMIGTSRDITEEKLHEQSIQKSEEKFRLLADSMPQFIWTGDTNGHLVYFNKSVFDYSGMTSDQLTGHGWIRIVHPEDRAANIRKWIAAVKNGGNFLFEHRLRRSDGLYRWQVSSAIPQYDSRGRIQMWVGTSTDIHDRKTFAKDLEEKVQERTRELQETNEVLEKTNRELEQFAYIASHDLQEPLRKIKTFADILKKNIHDEVSAQKYFSKIDSSAQRMGDLIKSVLDYSRLPAHPGQLMLTDLNEVIEKVRADFELTIEDKNAVIECDYLPAVPGVPAQLLQLFSNIIGNALKFCKIRPSIRITSTAFQGSELSHLFKADEAKRYAQIEFTDNGIGFDKRFKEQIFTIFQRLHGWQQYSGTGIGLAICKKIAENHRGFIAADSQPGAGSTFTVYLPA